jgi:hypothetical protein
MLALDASGKSAAHPDHRRYRNARTGKPAAGFCLRRRNPQRQFQVIEPVSLHFQ